MAVGRVKRAGQGWPLLSFWRRFANTTPSKHVCLHLLLTIFSPIDRTSHGHRRNYGKEKGTEGARADKPKAINYPEPERTRRANMEVISTMSVFNAWYEVGKYHTQ
ncbi:hypothetical protein EYR41_006990 [Orbilia oligospora]|uniref:Uncharacterized protein n=1 Tax=Orbilia oligospora TaxID=2813651 RepID=A0A8H2DY67_ORBOL|nr:hypothetical protein EYR41_006990 [Orbilia oligospora]